MRPLFSESAAVSNQGVVLRRVAWARECQVGTQAGRSRCSKDQEETVQRCQQTQASQQRAAEEQCVHRGDDGNRQQHDGDLQHARVALFILGALKNRVHHYQKRICMRRMVTSLPKPC